MSLLLRCPPLLDEIGLSANTYPMRVNRNQANALRGAVEQWNRQGLLDEQTTLALQQDIEVVPFDWKRLAKYSFWVALACVAGSIFSALADKALLNFIENLFQAPYIVKSLSFAILAGLIYRFGLKRWAAYPQKIFSSEAILFLGVGATAGAIYHLGKAFDSGSGHYSLLFLLSFLVYGILGYGFKSNLIWLFSLIAFGIWIGTETAYVVGGNNDFIGMNYPMRFVIFGAMLTAFTYSQKEKIWFAPFFRLTFAVGLLYLFVALYLVSIVGNYTDMSAWRQTRQIELFYWAILLAIVSAAAIYHGLKFDFGMTKGFGITFLLMDIYTRFCEYLWGTVHVAIFFALLAVSFWFLGNYAEKIWHLGETKNTP